MRTKVGYPYHLVLRLSPQCRDWVNELYMKWGTIEQPMQQAYISVMPQADFYRFTYPLGVLVKIRAAGIGVDERSHLKRTLLCTGHREVLRLVRGRTDSSRRPSESDWQRIRDTERHVFRSPVSGREAQNMQQEYYTNDWSCRTKSLKVRRYPMLTGELVWRVKHWDSGIVNEYVEHPHYDASSRGWYINDYKCPPEMYHLRLKKADAAYEKLNAEEQGERLSTLVDGVLGQGSCTNGAGVVGIGLPPLPEPVQL